MLKSQELRPIEYFMELLTLSSASLSLNGKSIPVSIILLKQYKNVSC